LLTARASTAWPVSYSWRWRLGEQCSGRFVILLPSSMCMTRLRVVRHHVFTVDIAHTLPRRYQCYLG